MTMIRVGAVLVAAAALLCGCAGNDDELTVDGNAGAAASGTGNGATGGNNGAAPPQRMEACLVTGACSDGRFSGYYSPFCQPFSVRCEHGCKDEPGGGDVVIEGNVWELDLAVRYATATYCNSSGEGGAGGESGAGGDGGIAGSAE